MATKNDFVISGMVKYSSLNRLHEDNFDNMVKDITLIDPEISNPAGMDADEYAAATEWFNNALYTDKDGNTCIRVEHKGGFPIEVAYDEKTKKPFELPKRDDGDGKVTIKEPVNTKISLDVFKGYSEKYKHVFYSVQALAFPDASKVEYYESKQTGIFGE